MEDVIVIGSNQIEGLFKAPNLYLTSNGIEEYVSVVRMIAIALVIGLGILIHAVSDGIVSEYSGICFRCWDDIDSIRNRIGDPD